MSPDRAGVSPDDGRLRENWPDTAQDCGMTKEFSGRDQTTDGEGIVFTESVAAGWTDRSRDFQNAAGASGNVFRAQFRRVCRCSRNS